MKKNATNKATNEVVETSTPSTPPVVQDPAASPKATVEKPPHNGFAGQLVKVGVPQEPQAESKAE